MHQVYIQTSKILSVGSKPILCTFKIILCIFLPGKISLGRWMPICSVQKLPSRRNITSKLNKCKILGEEKILFLFQSQNQSYSSNDVGWGHVIKYCQQKFLEKKVYDFSKVYWTRKCREIIFLCFDQICKDIYNQGTEDYPIPMTEFFV